MTCSEATNPGNGPKQRGVSCPVGKVAIAEKATSTDGDADGLCSNRLSQKISDKYVFDLAARKSMPAMSLVGVVVRSDGEQADWLQFGLELKAGGLMSGLVPWLGRKPGLGDSLSEVLS